MGGGLSHHSSHVPFPYILFTDNYFDGRRSCADTNDPDNNAGAYQQPLAAKRHTTVLLARQLDLAGRGTRIVHRAAWHTFRPRLS
eukprot:6202983-Pleurochrysis_carterae.AAC.2